MRCYVSWKTTGYYRKDSLKLAARCPVSGCWPFCSFHQCYPGIICWHSVSCLYVVLAVAVPLRPLYFFDWLIDWLIKSVERYYIVIVDISPVIDFFLFLKKPFWQLYFDLNGLMTKQFVALPTLLWERLWRVVFIVGRISSIQPSINCDDRLAYN